MYIKITPISQRTILFRKATYAMAKKRRNTAAWKGKKIKFYLKKNLPNSLSQLSYKTLTQSNSAFIEAEYNVYLEFNH